MMGQFYGPVLLHWMAGRVACAKAERTQIPLSGRTGGTGFTGSRCPKGADTRWTRSSA